MTKTSNITITTGEACLRARRSLFTSACMQTPTCWSGLSCESLYAPRFYNEDSAGYEDYYSYEGYDDLLAEDCFLDNQNKPVLSNTTVQCNLKVRDQWNLFSCTDRASSTHTPSVSRYLVLTSKQTVWSEELMGSTPCLPATVADLSTSARLTMLNPGHCGSLTFLVTGTFQW